MPTLSIYASLGQLKKIKAHFLQLKPAIDALNPSPNISEYYATWVQKARLSQLKQILNRYGRYLYLLAFIQHQFYLRQDYLVDIIIQCVQWAKNAISKTLTKAEELTRTKRRQAIRYLTQPHHRHCDLIDDIQQIAKNDVLTAADKLD